MAGPKHRVLREVEVLARVHTRMAIETLALVAGCREETPWEDVPATARVQAASALLDRGWGRPSQTVTVDSHEDTMSDEELARHVEQRIAILASAAGRSVGVGGELPAGSGSGGSGPGEASSGAEEAAGPLVAPRVVH